MDVFKQNWGQRIQHDPYVNFVLNSDTKIDVEDPTYVVYYVYYGDEPSKMNPGSMKEVNGEYYQKRQRRYNPDRLPFHRATALKNPVGLQEVRFKYKDGRETPITTQETRLHDNTRPQSLYNLRYASIR